MTMPPALMVILYILAVARAVTIVTHDEITRLVRSWLIARFDPSRNVHRSVVYLLGAPDDDTNGCPWCVSVWVGAVTAPLVLAWGDTPAVLVPVLAMAASQVTGMIYKYGRQ